MVHFWRTVLSWRKFCNRYICSIWFLFWNSVNVNIITALIRTHLTINNIFSSFDIIVWIVSLRKIFIRVIVISGLINISFATSFASMSVPWRGVNFWIEYISVISLFYLFTFLLFWMAKVVFISEISYRF